jgi:SAM-dependent methyltransferase
MNCPACGDGHGRLLRTHDAEAAAQHFVPRGRDPVRHATLVGHLTALWGGQGFVGIETCEACGFRFAVPWVGGDQRFYALVHLGEPHYPADRWEYGRTLQVLEGGEFARPLRLLEVGAAHGAFLDRVRALPHGPAYDIMAADYDQGAVRRLREKGYPALVGSLGDVRAARGGSRFDVICMYHTLEHMADIDGVFREIGLLLESGGSFFASVPNADATTIQEELTEFYDMPPNHVAAWNPVAIERAATRRGFQVVGMELQPIDNVGTARRLALYSVNARSARAGTIDGAVNGLRWRPARGALKAVLAGARVPGMFAKRDRFRPLAVWVHLRTRSARSDDLEGSVDGGYRS